MPLVALIVVAVSYYAYRRATAPVAPAAATSPRQAGSHTITPPPPAVTPAVVQPPAIAMQPISPPNVAPRLAPEMVLPIQDQATIDFSIGSPVIKRGGADDEAMREALKEIEEATKNLTIPPSKQPSSPAPKN